MRIRALPFHSFAAAAALALAACGGPPAADDAAGKADATPAGSALAAGQAKFLGSAHSPLQSESFLDLWNKVTPENAGKWGEVEERRDLMVWDRLDAAYRLAKDNGLPFQMHVMVWGNQQPEWMRALPPQEQRAEIEQWFAAVAARYPQIDIVEVVNEPLHDPPTKDDPDGGNYARALGGEGASGWDWILESFRLARRHFPSSKLMLNDYSITNTPADARRYAGIVRLLQAENLIDVIGVQGHAFSTTLETPMSVHRQSLDLLASTGLPIHVTELDIDGPTDEQQLADMQRIFPVFWEHPGVAGITLWGWRPGVWRHEQRAYLIDAEGRERPALQWLRRYLRGEAKAPGDAEAEAASKAAAARAASAANAPGADGGNAPERAE